MFKNPKRVLYLLIMLTVVLVVLNVPLSLPILGTLKTRLGLDLSGGSRIVLQADMNAIAEGERAQALESAREVIGRRINFFGVSEPTIQTARTGSEYRIIIEMPGVTNAQEAIETIGQTAKLEFREFVTVPEASPAALTIPTLESTAQ